jgi:hypothetical protein
MTTDNRPLLTYRVRVAHHEFKIKAHDAAEAILLAKRQLSHELPRLYDVIRKLAESNFQVEHAA